MQHFSQWFNSTIKRAKIKSHLIHCLVRHMKWSKKITGLSLNKFLITLRFQHSSSKVKILMDLETLKLTRHSNSEVELDSFALSN
jgi:hypothetical protein